MSLVLLTCRILMTTAYGTERELRSSVQRKSQMLGKPKKISLNVIPNSPYLFRSVSHTLGKRQNPVMYINM